MFENDLLISYAHLDDEPLLDGQPGWVSWLHRLLEIRVAQLLGVTPKIWRDPKLQGNDYFSDTILAEQLPKVALLVSVLSPRYVQSEWCTREVKEFCRLSQQTGGVRIGDKSRIFKVIKTPVPLARHPDELQPLLGYEFYVVDPATGRPRELGQAYGPEAERQFLTRLDDLAYDVVRLLETLRQEDPQPPAAAKGTVYVAETSFDLKEECEAVKRDLLRNGYAVLPDRPLPLAAAELAAVVGAELARASLAVHLIGGRYGLVPDGADRSLVAIQHDLAAEVEGLDRLIWIAPGHAVEDERQASFLDHLRTTPGVHARAELLEIPLEDLKSLIHRRLAPPPERSTTREQAAVSTTKVTRLYLVCTEEDLEAIRPLEDFLFSRNCEVILPLFDEDEAQTRIEHEESLRTADAVLFFYGEAGELWLRRKLRELQKSAGLGRERPLAATGIYVAPPDTAQKERLRTLEAIVLRQPAAGFSAEALAPFLDEIERQREAAP